MSSEKYLFTHEDCYVKVDKGQLIIGNALITQTFDLQGGMPRIVSIRNIKNGDEWLQPGNIAPMFKLPGLKKFAADVMYISTDLDNDLGIADFHIYAKVDIICNALSLIVRNTWKVYPGSAFVQHEVSVKRLSADSSHSSESRALMIPEAWSKNKQPSETQYDDYIGYLPLAEQHSRYEIIQLSDVTDHHNNLVRTDSALLFSRGHDTCDGNIAFIEKSLRSSGLLVIKEGPTPFARLGGNEPDFAFVGLGLYVLGTGLSPEESWDGEFMPAYGCVIGVYDGHEASRYALLDTYARKIHIDRPERDFFFMCNNWGDRSRDGRVSEPFLLKELEIAASLGVTHYQIDDGWQSGATMNSIHADQAGGGRWSGYHTYAADFWAPHPERLPNGFEPLSTRAEQLSIRLCLWFSPDSEDNFVNWEKDAEILIDLHRKYNICHFKLDGIQLRSKRGERSLLNMMRKVVIESGNRVYFNLDTTAQVRLGYFGRTQYGGLFLENRYTDVGNYFPHWTLRNLWMLCKYVPARKLQIEFLNVRRNLGIYGDDPLSPNACGILYSFGATLFSNPLAWMELSRLSDTDAELLSQIIRLLAPHHKAILSGHILPVGLEPSGTGWTGLQSVRNEYEGYLIVFRELTEEESHSLKLWGLERKRIRLNKIVGTAGPDVLAKQSEPEILTPDSEGRFRFALPAPLSFSLYSYAVEG